MSVFPTREQAERDRVDMLEIERRRFEIELTQLPFQQLIGWGPNYFNCMAVLCERWAGPHCPPEESVLVLLQLLAFVTLEATITILVLQLVIRVLFVIVVVVFLMEVPWFPPGWWDFVALKWFQLQW